MKVLVYDDAVLLGGAAADLAAEKLNAAIACQGHTRLILSTGASQFTTLQALVERNVDWSKVEMFHLDEYVALPETHPASFRKYLKERFLAKADVAKAYLVNGEGDLKAEIQSLTEAIRNAPVDVALIGIGENAHIAFNDPPADFETREAFQIVQLDQRCKHQQVGEGWFKTEDDVPNEAISMTPWQIMQAKCIISCVPGAVKASAIYHTLASSKTDPMVPATLLKEHPDFHLMLDRQSAAMATEKGLL